MEPARIMVEASASSSGQSQAEQQRPRAIVRTDPVLGAREVSAQQHLGEIVSARGELIQHLALRHQPGFLDIVERARHGYVSQHRAPIQGASPGKR